MRGHDRQTNAGRRWGAGTMGLAGLTGLTVMAAALLGDAQTARATVPTITTRNWKLDVKPDAAAVIAGRSPFEEYVLIEDDQVTAFEMARLGFGPILPVLSAGTVAGSVNFTVNLTSRNHGTCTWSGTMLATTMSGTLKWTKDGNTYNYTFTGVPYTPPADVDS